jgi:CelD/BcsL family acetyltransferase involved in cellulose biosynthesis
MIKIYHTFNNEIKERWLELEQSSYITPFQYYNWLLNWSQTAGTQYSLFIVCVMSDDRVEAIFPLGIDATRNIKKLEWLGGPHGDYMAPIVRLNSEALFKDISSIWKEVISALPSFDVLHLVKQVPKLGNKTNPFLDIYSSKISIASYQSNISNGWEAFKDSTSKKVHADSNRQRRRLAELGNLKFNILNSHENNQKFLEVMFSFKQERYKQMGVDNFLKLKGHRDFYLNMPSSISSTASIHCSTLTLDGEVIALHYGVIDKSTFFYLMPAHSNKWEKFSPGKLLLEDLLRWSTENNISLFDFTIGEESYKKIWSNESFFLHETNQPFTATGYAYLFLLDMSRSLKKFILKLLRRS